MTPYDEDRFDRIDKSLDEIRRNIRQLRQTIYFVIGLMLAMIVILQMSLGFVLGVVARYKP